MPRLCSSLLLWLLFTSSASAVTMDWTFVGDPGNAADGTGFGSVPYSYNIGTYEVTNGQYADFLNAKASSDPFSLYNVFMGDPFLHGGITRAGVDGSYVYTAIAGRENISVNYVSIYDAMRFANWMNNGQGNADVQTGAYTLLGGASTPTNGPTVTRNPGATILLASENEWYKAAYFDGSTYFDYPTGTDVPTICTAPNPTPNRANCDSAAGGGLTIVGSYAGSPSPHGTFDQGGNASELTDTFYSPLFSTRALRGGAFNEGAVSSSGRGQALAGGHSTGFRLSMIPEPSSGLLVIAGLIGLAVNCRGRS